MNYQQTCPNCFHDELTLMQQYQSKELVKCAVCSMVFDRRIPDAITLHKHYEQYGRNDYLSPITRKRYVELLTEFEQYKGIGKILDVGAGIGFFLETAKELGWEVYGTEFTDVAIKICEEKGIKMFQGNIEDIDFEKIKFDVVTSFELVEHLSNPSQHFQKINELLSEKGLYYLTTPNFCSLNSKILRDNWNVISFPEHLMYFTRKSIKIGLSKVGFKVVRSQSTGISPGRFINSNKKIEMDFSDNSTTDEHLREKIEKNVLFRIIKSGLNRLLTLIGIGESLKIWAVKS